MSDSNRDDPVGTYVGVLRAFGLGDAEIVGLHGDDPDVSDPDAVAHVRLAVDDPDPERLADRLPDVLARSDRGIDAPVEYWGSVPAVQLQEVLEPYGYDVTFAFEGEGTAPPFRLTVEDLAAGRVRTREFDYPGGGLGEYNYPALVAAVESMLGRATLSFVHLDGDPDQWRFALVEDDDLERLREEYGDRIDVFGRPVLAPDQPGAFTGGAPRSAVERRPEAVTSDADGHTPDTASDEAPARAGPAWIRDAAAREGGIDAVVSMLSDGGPRTHVSGRTADDILAEVPGRTEAVAGTTTTGSGIDDVLENLDAAPNVESEPSRVVSDRPVDPPWSDAGVDHAERAGGSEGGASAGGVDSGGTAAAGGESPDSLVGGTPEEVVVEGGVDELLAALDGDGDVEEAVEDAVDEDVEGVAELFASLEGAAADLESPGSVTDRGTDDAAGEAEETVDVEDVLEMVTNDEVDAPFTADQDDADGTAGAFEDLSAAEESDPDAVLAREDGEGDVDVTNLIEDVDEGPSADEAAESTAGDGSLAVGTAGDDGPGVEADAGSGSADPGSVAGEPLIRDAEGGTVGGEHTGTGDPQTAGGDDATNADHQDDSGGSGTDSPDTEGPASPPDPERVAAVVREAEENRDDGRRNDSGDDEGDEGGILARIRSLFGRMVGG